MQITGNYVKMEDYQATIELPPVKIEDIKEGDEVLVLQYVTIDSKGTKYYHGEKIIAHFPQQPKQESQEDKIELPKKINYYADEDGLNEHEAIYKIINQLIDAVEKLTRRYKCQT